MRHAAAVLIGLTLIACKKDNDKDGFTSDVDCNDNNPEIFPEADEVCNDIDDDCDGTVDNDAGDTWYLDADDDGAGDLESTTLSCEQPTGYVDSSDDCDDSDDRYHPGATEDDCTDPNDYNCDDSVGYVDADEDGFAACEDCDDSRSDVSPGDTEVCDEVDNDCDSLVDGEDDTVEGAGTWYIDYDGDGAGSDRFEQVSCDQPEGYVDNADDCDDAAVTTFPGADELCDLVDNDCDSETDEDAIDQGTFWLDVDQDGFGDTKAATTACEQPEGYSDEAGDCDDGDIDYYPGAPEEDCTDPADYNCDGASGYEDGDGDGFAACEECDDGNIDVNPDASEICDEVDNDCDGLEDSDDSDVTGESTWYLDYDDDGYGTSRLSRESCDQPDGYVDNTSDCDDASDATWPGAPETCDGADNDCNDAVDDDAIDQATWWLDADDDGYGDDDSITTACDQPDGYSDAAGDCDDGDAAYNPGAAEDDCTDPADYNCDGASGYDDSDGDGFAACEECNDDDILVNPDAAEICDDLDNDCDGQVDSADDDITDESTWYLDYDEDGYGSSRYSQQACDQPEGYVENDEDCDDARAESNPLGVELCDGYDNDCDTEIDEDAGDLNTYWDDADDDGYGDGATEVEACSAPEGHVTNDLDCDDADNDINPAADEICDGEDNDCDSLSDDADADTLYGSGDLHYADDDSDDYGDFTDYTLSCDAPSGYVDIAGDCDDGDEAVNPAATEVCDDIDNNCSSGIDEDAATDATTWYYDGDGDDYGIEGSTTVSCDRPADYSDVALDCDDADGAVNPAAEEVCNDGIDNDCDDSFAGCSLSLADADVILTGEASLDDAGVAFGSLGDLDADGYDEFMVGARDNDEVATDAGAAYLFMGPLSAGTATSLAGADTIVQGQDSTDRMGRDLAGGYDVDGDGVNDVVISAPNDEAGGTATGAAYLYSGTTLLGGGTLGATDALATWLGESTYDYLGVRVELADLTGDGDVDVVASGNGDDDGGSNAGAIYLFAGPIGAGTVDTGSGSPWTAKITGENASDAVGQSLAVRGDFDGDGTNDLAVGVVQDATSGTGAGATYLVLGGLSGNIDLATADAKVLGDGASAGLGNSVGYLGDQDGDGYDDLAIGAALDDTVGAEAGAVFVLAGRGTAADVDGLAVTGLSEAIVYGPSTGHQLGSSVSGDGDFDGDGTNDLAAGAANGGSVTQGMAYLFTGPLSGSLTVEDALGAFVGEDAGDAAGGPVGYVGDVTGTGANALGIGATANDRAGTDAGALYLVFEVGP